MEITCSIRPIAGCLAGVVYAQQLRHRGGVRIVDGRKGTAGVREAMVDPDTIDPETDRFSSVVNPDDLSLYGAGKVLRREAVGQDECEAVVRHDRPIAKITSDRAGIVNAEQLGEGRVARTDDSLERIGRIS